MSHTTSLPVVRFSLAGLLSVIITFLLFYLMQDLIRTSTIALPEDSGPTFVLNYVRVKQDEQVKHIDPVPPPTDVKDPPPLPPFESFDHPTVGTTPIAIGDIKNVIDPGSDDGRGIPVAEGDFLPVMKVTPVYPVIARTNGIEGYTIVEYTVTTTGSTRDIRVISAEPAGVFNKVSVDAAARFKYKPRVIDGTPVEVRGVQNKFTFQLE